MRRVRQYTSTKRLSVNRNIVQDLLPDVYLVGGIAAGGSPFPEQPDV